MGYLFFYALAFLQFSLVSGWKMGEGGQMHYRSDIYSIGCQEGTEEAFSSMNFNHFQMGNNIQTWAHLRYYQLSTFRHCVTQPSLTVVQKRLVVGVRSISICFQPDISPFIYYKGQIQEDHFMKKKRIVYFCDGFWLVWRVSQGARQNGRASETSVRYTSDLLDSQLDFSHCPQMDFFSRTYPLCRGAMDIVEPMLRWWRDSREYLSRCRRAAHSL